MRAASPGLLVSLGDSASKRLIYATGAWRLKSSKLWSLLGESCNSPKRGHLPAGAKEFRARGEPKFPTRNPSKPRTTEALVCQTAGGRETRGHQPLPGPGPASGLPPAWGSPLASRFPAPAAQGPACAAVSPSLSLPPAATGCCRS